MVELFEQELKTFERHSSKGNQLKWKRDNTWYKADYAGYESLSEYIVSNLLIKSSLNDNQFVRYGLEKIKYRHSSFVGTKSIDFLDEGWQIITLERLYKNECNRSLYECIWKIREVSERFSFLSDEIIRITGIKDFGRYLAILLTIDGLFLNEDRHLHNIAVLMNNNENYRLCPIFDNGAALLSDITLDYPLGTDIFELIDDAKSKTISQSFDEQVDVAEAICGQTIQFTFTKKDIDILLNGVEEFYNKEIIERVRTLLYQQIRKYNYLFKA